VIELRQFDLQLAFGALRALRKDIENQAGAVDDPTLQQMRSRLRSWPGDKFVIEDHQVGLVRGNLGRNFLDLPLPA
jgi:hypothetical protein